jgi:sporulation protein YlmC with PRC-barrel domain
LGEEGCKEWLGRAVYSIDGRRLGEIAALTRDSGNRVVALNANIGGYLGFDEKRVRIGATQIRAVNADGLVLDVSEAAARNMPGIPNR